MLGRGGMGVVVQAMHLELQQPVAVKLMLPEVVGKRRFAERFVREVQAAASLRSEHVARVIATGVRWSTTVRDTAVTGGGRTGVPEKGH